MEEDEFMKYAKQKKGVKVRSKHVADVGFKTLVMRSFTYFDRNLFVSWIYGLHSPSDRHQSLYLPSLQQGRERNHGC